MPRCAFLTMDDLSGFVSYDALVRGPLADLGWSLDEVPWRSPTAAWDEWDVVVIRTTWDYQSAPDAFVRTLDRIAAVTSLRNGVETVRWNLRKRYLRELAERGVRIVPTSWGRRADERTMLAAFDAFGTPEIVIKPEVGANADDVIRLCRSSPDFAAHVAAAARLFRNRRCMLQPFLASVPDEGEFSLIFFAGEYSHTILKTPKLQDFRVQEEHGGTIRAVEPEPRLLERARHAIAALGTMPALRTDGMLYARTDFVRLPDDDFALMELELIEPSLYLSYDDAAPARFARAIDRSSERAQSLR